MVFLYRQFIELRLKEIIELGQGLLDEPVNIQPKILEDHKLLELWKPCRSILEKIGEAGFWPKMPATKLDNVGRLVNEFHDVDPWGINFRYSKEKPSRGGRPTLPDLNRMGVRNLYRVMRRLDFFFTAQLDGIDYFLNESNGWS